jgi:multidrug resistance efflux pump
MVASREIRAILLRAAQLLKVIPFYLWKALKALWLGARKLLLSVRAWILFILVVIAALVAYYVLSDLYTPFTTEAYVQAYVVQVAARVEGQVVRVCVEENQAVKKGDLLFEIDSRPYKHQLELLTAKRVKAVQQVAQMKSDLAAAKADDSRLAAEEAYAKVVHDQETLIYKKEATTDRNYVAAEQKYKAAQAAREQGEAQTRKIEQALAAQIGEEHAIVAEVEAQLAQAQLNLEWTRVYAPANGFATNVQLRDGSYVHVGTPVITCVDSDRWWVVANFRENALSQLRAGQIAHIAFRSLPARVFGAKVVSVGRGVSQGQGVPSGQLPDVKVPANWVPPAQRFQVRLKLDEPDLVPLRVGMTGSVAVYTQSEGVLNHITNFWHQMIAWLYHL